ncbi:hypothetical protein BDN72DRAFT_843513 [Pluteus cervinus]|uniref:Uncharacterized protein n=1 Tax=Pluteus cervinus TaxID=181527 RepID=A0ACD3ANG5_9AGAR|nr:hypothetical protein BDN72DRAFT_843513 [Pluteus cervinus]
MSPPSTTRAGILDLPMELLLKIMHDPDTNLFLLAQANHFLNALVMNNYLPPVLPDPHHIESLCLVFNQDERLESVGINSKTHRADDTKANLFAFISIEFEIKTVGKLVCKLVDVYKPVSPIHTVKLFIRKFQRLTLFIRRLQQITDIDLNFHIPDLLDELEGISNEPFGDWSSSLDDLIVACTKKGCKTLHVSGGRFPRSWLEIGNQSQPASRSLVRRLTDSFWPTTMSKPLESTATTVLKLSWEITQHSDSTSNSSTLRAILSSYDRSDRPNVPVKPRRWTWLPLATYIYNHPPHSDWPYPRFFSTTPLTNLTITIGYSILIDDGWKEFLAWFHIPLQPTLTHLTIHNHNKWALPARPLIKFIHNLTRLEHLTILPLFPAFYYMDPYPLALPNLISVCAPTAFLLLLCPEGPGFPFGDLGSSRRAPKLTSIQIIPACQYGHGHAYDTVSCQPKVAEVLSGHWSVARIALDLRYCGPGDFEIGFASYQNSTGVYPTPPSIYYPSSYQLVQEVILSASTFFYFSSKDSLHHHHHLHKIKKSQKTQTITKTETTTTPAGEDWLTVMNGDVLKMLKSKCRSVRTVTLHRLDGGIRTHDI